MTVARHTGAPGAPPAGARPKALLLDLGNVAVRLRLGPFFRALGRACEPERAEEWLERHLSAEALGHGDYERGRLDARGWHARLVEGLGLNLGFEPWLGLWNDTFEPNGPMLDLLEELRGQVRVWGLSNTNADHLEVLRRDFRVLDRFEGVTASCSTGARKPEAAIYAAACASLGLAPSELLYLDDVAAFVDAARGLGIPSFHYTFNDAELRAHLKSLGFSLA